VVSQSFGEAVCWRWRLAERVALMFKVPPFAVS
jgi:hypothetical protein